MHLAPSHAHVHALPPTPPSTQEPELCLLYYFSRYFSPYVSPYFSPLQVGEELELGEYEDDLEEDDDEGVSPQGGEGGEAGQAEAEAYTTVYSGAARDFNVRELAPACRYRVRVRATNDQGASVWSAAVAVETDAADSTHRIQFEQMQARTCDGPCLLVLILE